MPAVSEKQLLDTALDLASSAAAEKAVRDASKRQGAADKQVGRVDVDLRYTRTIRREDDGVWLFLARAGAEVSGVGGAKVRAFGYCAIVATVVGTERKLYFINGDRGERIWDDELVGVDFAKRMMEEAAAKPEEDAGAEPAEAEPAKKRARSASPHHPPPAAAPADGPDDGPDDSA